MAVYAPSERRPYLLVHEVIESERPVPVCKIGAFLL